MTRREALRGAEVHVLDLIFKGLTSEQWAELLSDPLGLAAAIGERELAQRLVQAGAEIGNALHDAIDKGHGDIANDLLDRGASLEAKDIEGYTPLHAAALVGQTEMMQLLLLRGADKDALDNKAKTPLFWAVYNRHPSSALALLAAGADVNLENGEFKIPVIQLAAQYGHVEILRAVIEHRADVDAANKHGDTALHIAAWYKKTEAVDVLVEAGANIEARNRTGRTPLHGAALEEGAEMVQQLLQRGADKDALEDHKVTPLFMAVSTGNSAVVLALLAAGADVSLPCGDLNSPVLHAAAQYGRVEILRALIEHGADVDAIDAMYRTALNFAAKFNQTEAIDVLVEAGANIEAPASASYTNYSPLHSASNGLNREALFCLLNHGANINAQAKVNFATTPLMMAAAEAGTQGAAEVVEFLLREGADETVVSITGTAAIDVIGLHAAEENSLDEDVERVRKLLANAPADRAWRRRGYLVLCRAHSDRVEQRQVMDVIHQANGSLEEASGCNETVEGSNMDGRTGGDWAVVVSKVLLLQEEDVFRTIVGYL